MAPVAQRVSPDVSELDGLSPTDPSFDGMHNVARKSRCVRTGWIVAC